MTAERTNPTLAEAELEQLDQITQHRERRQRSQTWTEKTRSPGDTELAALWNIAWRGTLAGWWGAALAGGAVGTLVLPVLGTVMGFVVPVVVGPGPMLLAGLQFAVLRGRIPITWLMTWAGVLTGMVTLNCLLPPNTHRDFPSQLILIVQTIAGFCGGVGARLMTKRSIRKFDLAEGLGTRSWQRFGVLDLLLQTTWVAIVVAFVKTWELEKSVGITLAWFGLSAAVAWLISVADRSVFPKKT
ncbi:hypothetical protein NG895_01145 [Aeoliella sp. ICT_H6.2]|uniref:Uncharacterized protein n=1 Tax=Aeoliella straminimaris TaxID=2954799 RepID=A0A9X2F6G5_9BACT|nr:hypothetical protein [Aeoliella straminimaris]MCO6042502.1 hypothetical protein [Aeoliella straminimaris]